MIKIYKFITRVKNFNNRKSALFFCLLFTAFTGTLQAQQVTLTADAGVATGTFSTLREAFTAINAGTHGGNIVISINANTSEGPSPAVLNSNNADPAGYLSILIQPSVNGVSITGNPAAGFGVIELNGADNVIINGDNPNTGGTNRDLTINNAATNTAIGNSCIRIATSAAVLTADNITIQNLVLNGNVTAGNASGITNSVASANNSFGIYCGGNGGATDITDPTAIVSETANPAIAGTTINNLTVTNNAINQCGRAIVFNGAAASVSSGVSFTNNLIGASGAPGAYPYSTITSTVYTKGIYLAGANAASITGNTIRNLFSYINTNIYGVEFASAIGTGIMNISNNTMAVVANNGTAATCGAIFINALGGSVSITQNTISTIISQVAGVGVSAVQIANNGGAATISENDISDVKQRNTGQYGAHGINLSSAANGAVIQNNFIYNILNTGTAAVGGSFGNNRNVDGILLASGSNHKVYHNSISLYGASTANVTNAVNCLAITGTSQTGMDIRNNIFSNTVTGGSASDVHSCLFFPFGSVASMNLTLNNNAYYTGSVAGKSCMAFAGAGSYNAANLYTVANFNSAITTPATNWRSFSTLLGNTANDNASFANTTVAPFTSATDLHIPAATLTQLESGGAAVAVATDIDLAARNLSTPDIGADEFVGILDDKFPPVISFALPVACGGPVNRVITATITDATGVPTDVLNPAGLPVLYWRVNAGAWTAATAVYLSPTQYQFTFDGLATLGQVVDYYIVAQDLAGTPNVIANPSAGAGGYTINPPAAATAPTTLYSYTIIASLAGSYNVGAGQAPLGFNTLTDAVNAYNVSCISGPVTFLLVDANYPSETFPITVNSNGTASAVNTLTIRPNTAPATAANISGANGNALFKFNGADYVTIDGLNTGGSSLTFFNTNTGLTASTIWIGSASASDAATNNAVKNCAINGSGSSTAVYGVFAGASSSLGTAATAANSNNTISGNNIKGAQNGIFISGKTPTGFDQSWVISNNTIGSILVNNDKMGARGILVQGVQNFTISGNTINGVIRPVSATGTASTASGISVFSYSQDGSIFNNRISDVKHLNTVGWGANGIHLGSNTNAANITVYNNFIWDIAAQGSTGVLDSDNGNGIMLNSGGGYNIYYNSVHMTTDQVSGSGTTAAINISSAITAANSLNIRNNIFSNIQTVGTRYAIYSGAAATVYSAIDNNNYYKGSAPNLGFLVSAKTTLVAWQIATGKDVNSAAIDPLFTSAVNLHLQLTSPLNARAVVIGTITTDIDAAARSGTVPDIGADEITPGTNCTATLAGGTAIAATAAICISGSTYLSATVFTTGVEGLSYQWEVSTDNFTTSANLGTQTNPYSAFTGIIAATRYYRLRVNCSFGGTAVSNTVTVTVNNPSILSSAGATRCGPGTVNLTASSSVGSVLNWYNVATGGVPLGTGSPFTTPSIPATTTFYVGGVVGGSSASVGAPNTSISGSLGAQTGTTPGIIFDVLAPNVTITSVDIYPTAPIGTPFRIDVKSNNNTIVIATISGFTTVSGTIAAPVAQTVNLGFIIPNGTGYRMTLPMNPSTIRNSGGVAFPYTIPAVISLTGSTVTGFYYYCYNWIIFSGCESPRTAVTATVTPPPAMNAPVASPSTICDGQSSTLSITSGYDPNYAYTWNPGALPGASVSVSPSTTTTYTVNALATGGPNVGCTNVGTVTVNVNSSPVLPVVSNDTTICAGGSATLTAVSNTPAFVTDYIFNASTGASLDAMSGATEIVSRANSIPAGTNGDDQPSGVNLIGFTFNFNNTNYTQFSASPDGWILLGGAAATNSFTNNVTLATNIPKIYPYWDDVATGINGAVSYLLTGTAPNRILKLQWNVTIPRNLTGTANSIFQAWLYETINKIEFRYGTMNTATASVSSGLTAAPSTTNFQSITFSTNTVSNAVANNANNLQPPLGTMYTFTPPTPTITWLPIANLTPTTGSPVVATPPATVTYVATATNLIGCFRKDSVIVTVQPSTASISIAAVPSGAICPGTSVTFTATPTNGGTPTYQWYVGVTPVGTNSPTYTNAALTNGQVVTCQMTSSSACVVGGPVTSNAINMIVNPNLPASVSIAAAPGNIICSGTSVTFTATPTNPGTTPVYQWYVGVTPVGINSPTYTNAALTNGQVVTVQMTSNALCVTGSPATSNAITMTVNPNITASVSIAAVPSGSICSGTSVTFTATPTNGGTPAYQWYVGVTPVGTNSPTYTSTTLANGDNVSVQMTTTALCATPIPAISNTITMTVTGALPASVSIVSSGALCTGNLITFTATPVNGGTPTYQWLVNSLPVGAGTNIYSYIPLNGDIVEVEMTTSLTCAAPSPATSNQITVALNASPNISSVTADCNNILTGSGQQVTLTAAATAGSGTITTYQWYLGAAPVGPNSATYTTNAAGSYTVTVTNSNGCSTTSSTPVVITSTTPALAAGTYIIPSTSCTGFDKISSAVNYINANGISGAGGVIFNITPAYTETAPVGGFAITATGTAANTIAFQRAGAGANPIITAGLQVAGTNNDAVFKLIGADYITIQNLTLQENAGNTVTATGATNTMTEWAVALLYLTNTNGPNNNTIQNNTISLNKAYPNSFGIYSNLRHSATVVVTQADITNTTGGSNKIYGNAISNINNPIFFLSPGTNMSSGNDIGGGSAVTGNTITNWGSNTVNSGTATFFGVAPSMIGMYVVNQTGLNISWNSLTSAVGINVGAAGFRGMYLDFVTTAPTGTFTNSITNNTIALNNAATVNGAFEAINQSSSTGAVAVPGITLNINNNSITSVLSGAGSLSPIVCISNSFPSGVLSISDNVIKGNTSTATGGGFTGIINTAAVATSININNNQLGDAGTNAITFSAGSSGATIGITNTGAAAASTLSISTNTITRFSNTGTGAMTMINAGGNSTTRTINSNPISIISGGGVVAGIILLAPATTVSNASLNNISGLSSSGIASGVTGIQCNSAGNLTSNTITNLASSGVTTATITGILAAAANLSISLNTIHTLTGAGTTSPVSNGISILVGGAGINVFKNKIYNLSQTAGVGVTNPLINGILASATTVSTTANIYNNFISDLKAPVANIVDAIRGINITATGATSNYNVYYNTVYLNATSTGTNFGTTGIFHTGAALATTAALTLRNNIIDNQSTFKGTGLTVAFRRGNTNLVNYTAGSNNNSFYAGVPGANNLVFSDGTTFCQNFGPAGLAGTYQTVVGARDAASVTVPPLYVNVATTPYDLHLLAAVSCNFDGQGDNTTILIPDDIDADLRSATITDIGADEFIGTGGGIGVWKGNSSNWMDINNWCGAIPNYATNVTIPTGLGFYPIITTATPVAKNVSIAAGGSITITGVGKLAIHGTITNAGTFTVVDGTIELAGTTAQTIPAGVFQNNDLKNLVINNGAGVTLGGILNLYGKLSFTGSNRAFGTAGFLTLRSTATGTASVGDITNNGVNTGNTITGDVTVERFTTARRAWRLLSVPTQNNLQTIHEAWQENQAANAPTPAGYGIHITKDSANWNTYGFDIQTLPGPSMKVYQPATNNWKGITSTINVPGVSDGRFVTGRGYMVLVRGDRTVNTFPSAATTSVLRDKGALVTGTFAAAAIGAGQFAVIGNPYASAVDFTKLTRGNLNNAYYLWDPQMGSLGAYVTFTGPLYVPAGSISYTTNNFIESGQAFFVQSSGLAGSLSFLENSKVDGSNLVSRPISTGKQLRTKLYVTTGGSPHLYDAVINEFDNSYANTVDEMDAMKLLNFGENLGIKVADKILSVERRAELSVTDTIFYNLGNSRVQNYQLEFIAENIDQPGLSGFLEDNYLHTSTVVSMTGTTKVDFSVINEAGSYASDRFRLVFKQVGGPVPVTFTSVRAHKQDRNIVVDWKVEHEQNIHHYNVERSGEGRNFTKVGEQAARGTGAGEIQYSWLDTNPYGGDNFYRIISVGMASEKKQSQVVKVNMEKLASAITVFPNPVREDGIVYVSLENKAAGSYQVMIVNAAGQVLLKQSLNHGGGSSVYSITPGRTMAHGNYLLNVVGDDEVNLSFKIVY